MTPTNKALIVLTLAVAVAYYTERWPFSKKTSIITDTLNDTYDYIVVGGGSAGCVLAARLSEDPNNKVLLVEAGGHYDQSSKFQRPGSFVTLMHGEHDWEYYTERQQYSSLGQKNVRSYWPRGRILGGTSAINALVYARGSPYDFDEWAAKGLDGWGYADVLPYFLKSEDIQIDELKASRYHSSGGPFAVSSAQVTPLAGMYLKAAEEMGFKINSDYNAGDQEGFSYLQVNTRHGVRSSTGLEYLGGTAGRDNLHIAINTVAVKIEIEHKRTQGVYVIRDGRKQFLKANKEVILSAGAINSPQLLLLSGIGPKEHLEEMNIPAIEDLPVGENLDDHLMVFMFNNINVSYSITQAIRESWSARLQYSMFGTGPLSVPGTEAIAFVYIDESKRGKTYPDMQLYLFSSLIDRHNNLFNFEDEMLRNYYADSSNEHGFIFNIVPSHQKSKGSIRLKSTDPFDHPRIDPQYLADRRDVDEFIAGIRIWEQFVQTPTMKQLGVNMEQMNLAVCAEHTFRTDEYWECFVRHFVITGNHHCSTCRMGTDSDTSAVVDEKFRVRGIDGLRVVDASVFPNIISGNINAAIIMMAEKAADMIRDIDSVKQYKNKLNL